MIRYFVLLFNMIGVFFFRTFFVGDVTLTQTAPSKANPGDEFTVEISINKGTLGGFAQMKCEIPEGFTAEQGENAGSEFKFTGQIVRFTWTSLPGDATLKVSYKIKVAAGLSGVKSLAGKFSYVLNNVKNSVELNTVDVTVGNAAPETVENTTPPPPNPTTTTTPPPDPTTTTTNTSPPPPDNTTTPPDNGKTSGTSVVTATRKMPKDAKPGDDFTVEITINKGALKGFARYQDVLPEGLSATAGETKGGTFSFLDQKAKIVWDNVPADEQIIVSYKVHVSSSTSSMGDQSIEGLFSYVENDEPKKIVLTPSLITIDKGEQVVTNNTPPDTTAKHNTVVNNTPPPDTTTKHNTVVTNNTPPPDTTTKHNVIPTPNGKVNYKVQICAAHNTVAVSYFQNKYGISDNVNIESHEGWTKYTTGSFKEYKAARDHRETIKSKGVGDAFVTAYNQGTRITVQEALMISNQQWFR